MEKPFKRLKRTVSNVTLRIPMLHMLPAFEAAGRLSSFKMAADELCVTPSAISQQIKQLESHMDVKLFNRTTRRVELTEVGNLFYNVVQGTLDHYKEEFQRFSKELASPYVRLSTVPFIAHDLLIPAMYSFTSENRTVDLRIETSEKIVDLTGDSAAAAVRIGDGNWPGIKSRLLAPLSVNIVGSTKLLKEKQITDPEELKDYPLIHARTDVNDWEDVAKPFALDLSENKHLYMDNYLSAIALAEQGAGLLIAMLPISKRRIETSDLVSVFPQDIELAEKGFYFVNNNEPGNKDDVDVVFEWVLRIFDQL